MNELLLSPPVVSPNEFVFLYLYGILCAIVSGVVFIAVYSNKEFSRRNRILLAGFFVASILSIYASHDRLETVLPHDRYIANLYYSSDGLGEVRTGNKHARTMNQSFIYDVYKIEETGELFYIRRSSTSGQIHSRIFLYREK